MTPRDTDPLTAFDPVVEQYRERMAPEVFAVFSRFAGSIKAPRGWDAVAATDENDVLLRRLDAWTEGDNAGPLIRWAAAHLRGEQPRRTRLLVAAAFAAGFVAGWALRS